MIIWSLLVLLAGPIETIDSEHFSKDMQKAGIAATVRFDSGGTGVIVKQQGPFVFVLTANHVVSRAQKVNVQVFSDESYPLPMKTYRSAEVIARQPDKDLAVIQFVTRDTMPAILPVCPRQMLASDKSVPAMSVGCTNSAAPTCQVDLLAEKKLVKRNRNAKAVWLWEVDKASIPGRSGGPLIDKQGFVIGICNGRNDGKGYYCHTDEIHEVLTTNGLTWIFEVPIDDRGAVGQNAPRK